MDSHTDVLIIGGGVIGLSCAYYLMKAGRHVRIIERDSVGSGASHGNCGLIYISGPLALCAPGTIKREIVQFFKRTSPLYVKPGLDPGRFGWLLAFARKCNAAHFKHATHARHELLQHSQTLYDTLFKAEDLDGDLEKKGILMVYKSESEWQDFDAEANAHLKPYGLEAKPVVGDALFELEPALSGDVYGGWYHPLDSHLRPDLFIAEFKNIVVREGASVEEDSRLDRFEMEHGRINGVITGTGRFSAESYVLAAGAWTPQITRQLGLKIPVQPGKGYSLTMEALSNGPKIPCYFHERRVVATPWKSGFRLGGTMEFSGFDSTIYPERIHNLKAAAREYLKEAPGDSGQEEWIGLRPMTYDDLPIIDRAPGHRNLILATGHGMMGIAMAPSTGRLVAEIVTAAEPHIDPTPYSVNRF
jgi:D-amino-acid dehydrogenase